MAVCFQDNGQTEKYGYDPTGLLKKKLGQIMGFMFLLYWSVAQMEHQTNGTILDSDILIDHQKNVSLFSGKWAVPVGLFFRLGSNNVPLEYGFIFSVLWEVEQMTFLVEWGIFWIEVQ